MLVWNCGHWKLNSIVYFGHLQNVVRDLKIDDSVKYSLQKWIITHTYVIQYPIANDYTTVNFDSGNGGANNEIHHKVLLQVSVSELDIDMLKNMLLFFYGIW